ncbi:IS66 family transposase [Agaribacter marinus]|uniref:Transposase IS66 central domain-containing protein n=1 Tax=Agaribacter marinus TaxID=1431249 RepID=A0AA37T3W6_9ALTE|nr:transposase [Agaribacter marinus]GLR71603.1 hypothetical protein GCM10007852_25110 [Agaribacter marinus]
MPINLPRLKQFEMWLITSELKVLPKTKLGEAIEYWLSQWDTLQRYTLEDEVNIDNNRTLTFIDSLKGQEINTKVICTLKYQSLACIRQIKAMDYTM